jgi:hypothetical protein
VVGRIAIWVFASGVQIRVIGSLVVLALPLVFLGLMVTPPVFPAVALIVATYGAANGSPVGSANRRAQRLLLAVADEVNE